MRKLGIAIVGLGSFATEVLLPALNKCNFCRVSAIVTGTPIKAVMWSRQIGISKSNIYNYSNFDRIKDNHEVDIVYICLPDYLHHEFVSRAAKAKKHILCEKPLGTNTTSCKQMITDCHNEGVKLGIGYRLMYDPIHKFLSHELESATSFQMNGSLSYIIRNADNWRLTKELETSAPIFDLGIYGIQAACNFTNQIPRSVTAQVLQNKSGGKYIQFKLKFRKGSFLNFRCSFFEESNYLEIKSSKYCFELKNAFSTSGIKINPLVKNLEAEYENPLSDLLDSFVQSVKEGGNFTANAAIGLRDIQIIEAMMLSIETGKEQKIIYT